MRHRSTTGTRASLSWMYRLRVFSRFHKFGSSPSCTEAGISVLHSTGSHCNQNGLGSMPPCMRHMRIGLLFCQVQESAAALKGGLNTVACLAIACFRVLHQASVAIKPAAR